MFQVQILADSISEAGKRITTYELTYPRIIHSQILTHRAFSRSSASSRAIPVRKLSRQIRKSPFIPNYWGKNRPGMQATEELQGWRKALAIQIWLWASLPVLGAVWLLGKLGCHKQTINRLLEPWSWITVILTATEFDNFFTLRCGDSAQPELQRLAIAMRIAYNHSSPTPLKRGEWHLPFIDLADHDRVKWALGNAKIEIPAIPMRIYGTTMVLEVLKLISAGRCARVSYLTHNGVRDYNEDVRLAVKLLEDRHLSPFEHQAETAHFATAKHGNLVGWTSYRTSIPNESGSCVGFVSK